MIEDLNKIKNLVEHHTGLKLLPRDRHRPVVDARKIFFLLARKHTTKSLSVLGQFLKRDHATALHCINSAKNLLNAKNETVFRNNYYKLETEVLKVLGVKYNKTYYTVPRKLHPYYLRYAKKPLRKILIQRGQTSKCCYGVS